MFHRKSQRDHEHGHEHGQERRFARGEDWLGGRDRSGHGHRHMRGGRRRLFDHGDLRFVILRLIAEKPRHGYELIKAIEDKVGGAYSPSPGVIYPTLTMLEELGYAAAVSPAGDGKKLYAITPEGTAFLEQSRPAVEAIFARMAELDAAQGDGPAPQIMRAMENVKLALRLRLSRSALTPEAVRAVAEALDAAAVKIEQS